MIVNIHFSNFDKKLKYDFDENIKIMEIKEHIEKEDNMPFNKNEIKLIFSGRIIPNDKSLKDIKFASGNTFSALGKKIIQETPVIETPVIETPIIETPIIETPIIETSVQENENITNNNENSENIHPLSVLEMFNIISQNLTNTNINPSNIIPIISNIINNEITPPITISNNQSLMAKIEQMKEMGLTDVNRCKICLNIAGGNVEMAVNLYYEMNIEIIQSDEDDDDLEDDESDDE